jgi:hypothetical protein
MAPAPPELLNQIIRNSPLYKKYATSIDRESARELLARKMADLPDDEPIAQPQQKEEGGMFDAVVGVMKSPLGRAIGKEVVRGVFGLLGGTPTRRRRRTSWW